MAKTKYWKTDDGYVPVDKEPSAAVQDGVDWEPPEREAPECEETAPVQTALEQHVSNLLDRDGMATLFAPKNAELQFEAPSDMVIHPGMTMTIAFDNRMILKKGQRHSIRIGAVVVSTT